jgi:hypothetical protein
LAFFQILKTFKESLDWIQKLLSSKKSFNQQKDTLLSIDTFGKLGFQGIMRLLCLLAHNHILPYTLFYTFLNDALRTYPENMAIYFLACKEYDPTVKEIIRRAYEELLR